MQSIYNMEPNHRLDNLTTNDTVIDVENWYLEESLPDENSRSSICCISGFLKKITMVVRLNINAWTNTGSARTKQELTITEITKEEKPALTTIVGKWSSLAESKRVQNNLLFPNIIYMKLPRPFYRKCANVFKTSSAICAMMHLEITQNLKNKIYVCYLHHENGEKKVEAIAMVTLNIRRPKKPSFLYLNYLASHPKNLISPINSCEHQVGGAAAKLINHLTKEVCPQSNMEQIRLHSTKNAVSFYEKFGFVKKSKCMKLKINPI